MVLKKTRGDRIEIRSDWDSFPTYIFNVERNSYFAGREQEVHHLSHWLAEGGGGSVLISGVRGIGKTAFVYHSIRQIYEHDRVARFLFGLKDWMERKSDFLDFVIKPFKAIIIFLLNLVYRFVALRKVTVVPINAAVIDPARFFLINKAKEDRELFTSLYQTTERSEDKSYLFWQYILLQQLVAALKFSKVRSWSLRKRLDRLYRWSISEGSEVQLIDSMVEVNVVPQWLENILPYLLSLSLFTVFAFSSWITGLLAGVLLSLKISTTLIRKKQQETRIRSSNFDYLYSELNDILSSTRGEIFIFIVDELDKIEDRLKIKPPYLHNSSTDGETPDAHDDSFVDFFIRNFKNLVTITSGRFLFITSEKYYQDWFNKKGNGHPESSTFFGWDTFLTQASVANLVDYLLLIQKNSDEESLGIFSVLAFSLYLETGGHYSETMRKIRSYIQYEKTGWGIFSKYKPFIVLNDYKNLAKKARLGKLLENVIKQRSVKSPDRQRFEYIQREVLHRVLRHLTDKKGQIGTGTKKDFFDNFIPQELIDADKQIIKSQIEDLLSDLNKFAGSDGKTLNWNIPKEDSETIGVEMDLASVRNAIDDLPNLRLELTDLEEELVSKAEALATDIHKWTDIFGTQLIQNETDFIKIINPEYPDKYVSSIALAEKVNMQAENIARYEVRMELSDPREVRKAIDVIDLINLGLESDIDVISKYIENLIVGVKRVDLEGLNNLFQVKNKLVTIVDHTPRILLPFGKSKKKVIKYIIPPKLSSKEEFDLLLNNILDSLETRLVRGTIPTWQPTSADGFADGPWHEVTKKINFIDHQHTFNRFAGVVNSVSEYWRFGIGFGPTDETVRPLSGRNYTLIHIHKNSESPVIKWRRIWNKLVRAKVSDSDLKNERGDILDSNASQPIHFELRRQLRRKNIFIDVYVNGAIITKVLVPSSDLESVYFFAWGDGKEFAIDVSNMSFEVLVT